MASVDELSKLGLVPLSVIGAELAPLAKALPVRARDRTVRAWAMVDAEDYERLKGYSWSLTDGYVGRNKKKPGGGHSTMRLHREVMGLDFGDPRKVDHRDHDPLNCTKGNLRVCTHAQNHQNRAVGGDRNTSSQYRGVSFHKRLKKWSAYGQINGKLHHLGYRDDEEEAAELSRTWRAENMPFAID